MKLKADRGELAKAVKSVSRFLPRVSHLAVLEHLLFEASDGKLAVTGTNLDAGRRLEVEASVGDEGRILVPAGIASILAGASGDEVHLEADDKELTVGDTSASWKLKLYTVDEWPERTTPGKTATLAIEDWGRVRAVAQAAEPVSGKRPGLQGVHFHHGDAEATDSYQMAYTNISADTDHPSVLVPAHAVLALDADVETLLIGETGVEATLDDGHWWTRLNDSKFPNVRKLVDDQPDPTTVVTFDSDELTETLRRATLVGDASDPTFLRVLGHGVEITRRSARQPVFTELILGGVESRDTSEELVAFRAPYLRNATGPAERIRLKLTNNRSLMSFQGLGDDDWWEGAFMPVRPPGDGWESVPEPATVEEPA